MPYYDYDCSKHGVFEVFQRMLDKHDANCPVCGCKGIRLLSASALHGLPSQDKRMGKTRDELYQNLGKEGWMANDMWKYDKNQHEEVTNLAME